MELERANLLKIDLPFHTRVKPATVRSHMPQKFFMSKRRARQAMNWALEAIDLVIALAAATQKCYSF